MEASSIGELVECVRSIKEHPDQELWYRGHQRQEWEVLPTVHRGYSEDDERNFTNRFRSRAAVRYREAPRYDDRAYWLSIMQHYGLPTRLLDWSRSPLIAAYFSLEYLLDDKNKKPVDGRLWVLDPFALNIREGFEPVTPAIESHICESLIAPAFTHRAKENGKVVAVMATETDLRMFVQQGCFTIHSRKDPLDRNIPEAILRSIFIPAKGAIRMAEEMKLCGFRKGDLFPDLANLADELKLANTPK